MTPVVWQLGPAARLFAWREPIKDQAVMEDVARRLIPGPPRLGVAAGRTFVKARYRVADDRRAAAARQAVLAAFDKLEAELDRGDHLVGDLSGAPAGLAGFRESVRARTGFRWAEEMFRRHRR